MSNPFPLTPDPISLLELTRLILAEETSWTKNAFARDYAGRPINALSDEARCFCLGGAAVKAYEMLNPPSPAFSNAFEALNKAAVGFDSVACFNDAPERTHDEVLGLLDKALDNLREVKQ